jgi:hypothetical protein
MRLKFSFLRPQAIKAVAERAGNLLCCTFVAQSKLYKIKTTSARSERALWSREMIDTNQK